MKVDIISGFLGAGKTSLIKRLLELNKGEKIAILENEFGEISIDSSILNDYDIEIKEINSGCICCSVRGDLKKGIKELCDNYSIDKIIIEPSGIAKLSQIKEIIEDMDIEILKSITLIDYNNFSIYLKNFGSFYRDQIENADMIFINRVDENDIELEENLNTIKNINNNAEILLKDLDSIEISDFDISLENENMNISNDLEKNKIKNSFESISLEIKRDYTISEIEYIIDELKNINNISDQKKILRAKGILNSKDRKIHFEYLPNTEKIEEKNYDIEMGKAVIIGINLNREEIISLFE